MELPKRFFSPNIFTRALTEHAGMVLRQLAGRIEGTALVLTLLTQFGGRNAQTRPFCTTWPPQRLTNAARVRGFPGVQGLRVGLEGRKRPGWDRSFEPDEFAIGLGCSNVGHALETAVLVELERRPGEVTYVRTPEGYEVDFLARAPDVNADRGRQAGAGPPVGAPARTGARGKLRAGGAIQGEGGGW